MPLETDLLVIFANYYKKMKQEGKTYIPDTTVAKIIILELYEQYVTEGLVQIENLSHEEKVNLAAKTAEKRKQKSINIPKKNVNEKIGSRDFLVMVNGKAITNEEDAIAITRESLAMVSRNLTTTVEELKPLSEIKIKF